MSGALFDGTLEFGRRMKVTRLSLVGGEPTLHPLLPQFVRAAVRKGYRVWITSNGVCAPARLQEILASGLHGISFSVDGSTAAVHDALRPSAKSMSTFDRTLRSIREAVDARRDHNYAVCVNHTVFPHTLADIESMMRLSASLGVDRVRVYVSLPGDLDRRQPEIYFDPAGWMAVRQRLVRLAAEVGLEAQIPVLFGDVAGATEKRSKSPYLTVQPDGTLVPCCALARLPDRNSYGLGTVRRDGTVALNGSFVLAAATELCCQAIPALLATLPHSLRVSVESAGGLGCPVLPGPLCGDVPRVRGALR